VIFHLGSRVAALVDGQLPSAQADRAWEHVHQCGTCRAAVEREGWIKRELATLSFSAPVPAAPVAPQLRLAPAADPWGAMPLQPRPRRLAGLAAIGAGSLGAAMFGVLVLGGAPDSVRETPTDRRLPVTNLEQPVSPTTRAPSTTDKTDGAAPLEAVWVRMGL